MSIFQETWGNYLLKEFIETSAPPLISWWPQTLGWKLVPVFFLFFALKKAYLLWQEYKRNAYRREALTWLNDLPSFHNLEQQAVYRQLPALLRKTALTAFKRSQICHLQGSDWDAWLDKQCEKTAFTTRCAKQLHRLSFSPSPQLSPEQMHALINEISLWIKFHRRLDD